MSTRYLVPARDAEAEIEVKRSRFLATLVRADDEPSARALVERLRREHWDARHHCSAFVLGPPPVPVERSSDDGEPAGTAGAPMLEVLRGHVLSDVAVVVTRWFGGTLLGAGGLVRAYGDAVREVVAMAGTRPRELLAHWEVELDHADAGRIEGELRNRDAEILEVAYGARVTLRFGCPPSDGERWQAVLAELTGGLAEPTHVDEAWVDR